MQTEIVGATQHWDLSTAAGAREFQRFLIVKLGEIIGVVEEANDDDTSKQELTAALTALYAAPAAQRDDPAPVEQNPAPDGGPSPTPVAPSLAEAAPSVAEDGYLDALPDEEPEDDYRISAQRPSAAPPMPAFPGFGVRPRLRCDAARGRDAAGRITVGARLRHRTRRRRGAAGCGGTGRRRHRPGRGRPRR